MGAHTNKERVLGLPAPSVRSSLKNHLLTRLNVYVPTADNLVEVVDANNVQASAFRSAGRRITDQALHPENTIELLTRC